MLEVSILIQRQKQSTAVSSQINQTSNYALHYHPVVVVQEGIFEYVERILDRRSDLF